MNRRLFSKLAGVAAFVAAGEARASLAQIASPPEVGAPQLGKEILLEDAEILVAFDSISGALVRMQRKSSQWVIERRPELGVSFRLFVPLSKRRDNFVLGAKQRAVSVERISANQVRLRWKNLMSEHGGVLPITVTSTVTLRGGELTFEATIQNDSELLVEALDYPYFGDFTAPTADTVVEAHHMFTGALVTEEIHPHFANAKGYWGVRYPTRAIDSNQSQFILLQAGLQGIYVALQDPEIRYLMEFMFEQQPGVIDWVYSDVPRGDEISGLPVHLEFHPCHIAFVRPHTTFQTAPLVVKTYSGDWHAGLDVYKQWRATWFKRPQLAVWVRDVHSWMQLQVDGAEQDYTIPYRRLIQYGEECATNGVTAIQLVGWNKGGQDGGDPSLDTDPGLGTWQELHDSIAAIQAKGVKMIMFGKPVFADMSTDYYKQELYKYEAIDPFGNKYESNGYAYTSPTQLAGINQRRRAIMDVCSPGYRAVALQEFEKTLALGAAGWLFDEVMQHNGVLYNFSNDHGYTAPGYLYSGDIPLAKAFRAAADKVNPDFLFAGEGPGDWLMPYYPLGYYRIGTGTRHALRYIDSDAPLMAAVRGVDAREELNLCLLYRYIISYEPYNFKGHITDFPITLEYGKKIDAMRKRYRKFLWDAEFRDTLDAGVIADGRSKYSVFRAKDGKRAVVVMSLEERKAITAHIDMPGAQAVTMATPEQPEARTAGTSVSIPARCAVVVMEG